MKQKPCKYCGKLNHTSIQCFDKPRKPIKKKMHLANRTGKQYAEWNATRRTWIQNHPAVGGYWYCHYCGTALTILDDLLAMGIQPLTLDHYVARSDDPSRRHDDSNLVPACSRCNSEKGSMHGDKYIKVKGGRSGIQI